VAFQLLPDAQQAAVSAAATNRRQEYFPTADDGFMKSIM